MRIRELLIAAVLIGCGPRSAPNSAPAPTEPATPTEPAPPSEPGPATEPGPASEPAPQDEPAQAAGAAADGAACLAGTDCASGVCEGQGCDPHLPGTCMPKARACTRDLRAYCGCDGVTFKTSGSCPGRRFAARGACSASAP
ncbi:MAG TPA: hypothetical protein VFS15_11805 [Kofleriaceae bacterium]|nr:hypothetical protein [Kofleriaceae bacterium]